jgi:nucleotide-binding universal stress UspA family protein
MFKKIVWATDGSENSERALEYVESLARESGASVVVAHCEEYLVGPGARGAPTFDPAEDELHAKIAKQVEGLKSAGIDVIVRQGTAPAGASHVAHVIAEIAKEESADLVAAGTRGHSAIGGMLLGSVTQRLLGIAECPVLVVPHAG